MLRSTVQHSTAAISLANIQYLCHMAYPYALQSVVTAAILRTLAAHPSPPVTLLDLIGKKIDWEFSLPGTPVDAFIIYRFIYGMQKTPQLCRH